MNRDVKWRSSVFWLRLGLVVLAWNVLLLSDPHLFPSEESQARKFGALSLLAVGMACFLCASATFGRAPGIWLFRDPKAAIILRPLLAYLALVTALLFAFGLFI